METHAHVVASGLAFPESPRWRDGELFYAEKRAGRVCALRPGGETRVVAAVPGGPGGLGWRPDGALLVVSAADRCLVRVDDGEPVTVADLSALTVGRANDMVVDSQGRAYVGHFGYDLLAGAAPAPGSLVLVEPDGRATTVAGDLAFPNGCVIADDGTTLVVAESAANRLTAFTVRPDGALTERRTFADLGDVVPDGIALDREGAIWIADPLGCQVVRVNAHGDVTEQRSTGDDGAFACALGGDDGRTLFVCCYQEQESQQAVSAATGTILAMTVAVPGVT